MNIKHRIVCLLTWLLPLQILRNVYRWQFKLRALIKYRDAEFPRIVSIEINTHCNRACTYCPNVSAPQDRELIKDEVFFKIVERLRDIRYHGTVDFIFFSEPTLNPSLPEYIAHVKKRVPWCVTRICTNGDTLNHVRVKRLQDAGLNRIYAMRHNPTPDGWVKNMDQLSSLFPGLFQIMDIDEVQEECGLEDFGGLVKVDKVKASRYRDGHKYCDVHSHVCQIDINGNWRLCCIDYDKSYAFGNVLKHDILTIWNQPSFQRMRKSLMAGEPLLQKCKDCTCFRDRPAVA